MQRHQLLPRRLQNSEVLSKESFLNAQVGRKPSYAWRSIMAAKDIIMKGSRWCIGNGQKVHNWDDRWIPRPNSFKVISPRQTRLRQRCLKEGSTRPDSGSSSDNAKMKAIWKMVWQLDCPNKIKHFMWRACKNILPTRNRLKVKGVGCEDCGALCGSSETLGHIL